MSKLSNVGLYLPVIFTSFLIGVICCKKDGDKEIITDVDGNDYTSVIIGTQEWMVENLKTTRYNDGSDIPEVTDNLDWNNTVTPAYCWYNNDISKKEPYGALYNWHAVNTGKLCPSGWHVPSADEWNLLIDFLGENDAPGGKLKEAGTTHWESPNTGATNSTGFTGLPGGVRDPINNDGEFLSLGETGWYYSSSQGESAADGRNWALFHNNDNYGSGQNVKGNGYSVRCIKDQ